MDYIGDSSSSDSEESVVSVIPRGRPVTSFTSYDTSVKREKTSSVAFQSSSGDEDSSDADLEMVRSDLPQATPGPQQNTANMDNPTNDSTATPPTGPRSSQTNGKRPMSAAQRERQSQIMRERWARGGMDGVHKKIQETKKRKSMQGLVGDEDGRPSKRAASSLDVVAPSTAAPAALSRLPHAYTVGYTPAQLALWEYIRPYLDVSRDNPIPTQCFIPQLLGLPRERDVAFNARRRNGVRRPFADTAPKNVAALLLHITGKEARQPCSKCVSGGGMFDGCIILSPNADLGDHASNCSNCWYARQSCSYDETATAPRPIEGHGAHSPERDHIVVKNDSLAQLQQSDSETEDVTEQPSRPLPKSPAAPPSRPPTITLAPSGRPYCKWPDGSGNLVTMKGNVLLPDGYKVAVDSGLPYSCPVDNCPRRSRGFADLRALGYHFPRTHFGQLLNDNRNGTFSVVGVYDPRKLGNGGSYPPGSPSFPIVISLNPKPVQGPQHEEYAATAPVVPDPYQVPDDDHDTDGEEGVGERQLMLHGGASKAAMSMWDFIRPYLKTTTTVPDKGWVKELLPQPRVRELRWNPNRTLEFRDANPRNISAMIIQVTGETVAKPCTNCVKGRGPFAGCVVIAKDAPAEVRARMVSCANCSYNNRQVDCSIINWVVNRPQAPWPGYKRRGGQLALGPAASAASARETGSQSPSLSPDPPDHTPTEDREELDGAGDSDMRLIVAPREASGPARSRSVKEITRRPPSPERVNQPEPAAMQAPAVPQAQQSTPEQTLELQEWELAPGRLLDETSVASQDIMALSRAYLSSGKSRLHNDLEVHNEVITSGKKLSFVPMTNAIRSCFVGSGRLRVKVGENAEFTISHGSSFKIAAGESVWAQNRLCVEALLHVSTMTIYD